MLGMKLYKQFYGAQFRTEKQTGCTKKNKERSDIWIRGYRSVLFLAQKTLLGQNVTGPSKVLVSSGHNPKYEILNKLDPQILNI